MAAALQEVQNQLRSSHEQVRALAGEVANLTRRMSEMSAHELEELHLKWSESPPTQMGYIVKIKKIRLSLYFYSDNNIVASGLICD